MNHCKSTWLIPACLMLAGAAAQAASPITVYTSQADFLAAVKSASTDTFDSLTANTELGTQIQRTTGAYSYTASATGGLYSVAGTSTDTWLSTNAFSDTLTLSNFSSNVFAVGGNFFGTDAGGAVLPSQPSLAVQTLVFNVLDAAGNAFSTQVTLGAETTFLGISSSSAIASLSVYAYNNFFEAYPTVNNLTLAAAVPEPTSWLMLAIGIAIVAGASVRRGRES
jgi:hypothetical protein